MLHSCSTPLLLYTSTSQHQPAPIHPPIHRYINLVRSLTHKQICSLKINKPNPAQRTQPAPNKQLWEGKKKKKHQVRERKGEKENAMNLILYIYSFCPSVHHFANPSHLLLFLLFFTSLCFITLPIYHFSLLIFLFSPLQFLQPLSADRAREPKVS